MLDIMELWARDLMAVQSGAAPYEARDIDRLRGCGIDGRVLLIGVIDARKRLGSNVSWPNALESLYFDLIEPAKTERTVLSWQR